MEKDNFLHNVQSAYDLGANSYAENWNAPWPWLDIEREKFCAMLKVGETVADIGCNAGYDSYFFSLKSSFQVTGLDVSKEAIMIAKKQFPKVEFIMADILNLSALNRKFDGLWIAHSLLHIPVHLINKAIKEIKSITHSKSIIMLIMATASKTCEETADIKMKDQQEKAVLVPLTRWNIDEFKTYLTPFFTILWE